MPWLSAEDERAFGFVRLQTGDELSKRVKFVLVTWMGSNVSAMKRAKMSTDKTQIKALIQVSGQWTCHDVNRVTSCLLIGRSVGGSHR